MLKIDLHTHSIASRDGGIKPEQYVRVLDDGILDYIAITDHDRIDMATQLQKQLGEQIIVGEEVTTADGEVIGLFLKKLVKPGLSALDTAKAIKAQGGLVYIPHPFETVRKGLSKSALDELSKLVDIVEVYNGRAVFQNRGPQAMTWARNHRRAGAASSDAHGLKGVGATYSVVPAKPTAKNLTEMLDLGRRVTAKPPFSTLLYPKINRLKKRIKK